MYVTKWVLGAKNTYNLTIGASLPCPALQHVALRLIHPFGFFWPLCVCSPCRLPGLLVADYLGIWNER